MKASDTVFNAALAKIKTDLDAGFLYVFAGPVPANEGVALDMATQHTEVAKISISGGATGLTFATPASGVMTKTLAETWSATTAFDGFASGSPTLAPSFVRFGAAADNCRGASSATRLQMEVGGNGTNFEGLLSASPYADGAAIEVRAFQIVGEE